MADISDEEFERMTTLVKSKEEEVKKLEKDHKLGIVAHGKQGMFGDNNTPKPGMLDIKEKYKWEAWNDVKGMDKQTARHKFAELAAQFL